MTRILLLHQPVDGGVGRHVNDLFAGLSDRGHEILLVGPGIPRASTLGTSTPGLQDADRRMEAAHRRLDLSRAIHPRGDLSALRAYVRLLDRERPDLVHAHSSKAGAVARLTRLLRPRIPVVYTPHGFAFAGFFERRWERAAYREAERSLSPLTSALVAVCCAEARLAAQLGSSRRIRVIHNGVDLSPATPPLPDRPGEDVLLCTIARLQAGKGLEVLIDAMAAVRSRQPAVRLAVVGGGPMADSLQARARDRGVADGIDFLGELSDPQSVIQRAQVFVLPSLAESFPYVVLDAMAAGLPVVATRVGGIPEAVTSGQSGLLVAPGDAAALARAILGLVEDPAMASALGAAARERVGAQFGRAQMIERLLTVYEEVLTSAAGGTRVAARGQ